MALRMSSKWILVKCVQFVYQVLLTLSLHLAGICVFVKNAQNLMKSLGIAALFVAKNSFPSYSIPDEYH